MLVSNGNGFLITLLMRYVYRGIHYQKRSILTLSLIVIGCSITGANIRLWADSLILRHFLPPESFVPITVIVYLRRIWSHLFIFLPWSTLYFVIKFWLEWRLQQERTEKANALAQSAQLQMLRYQLNPHFLFNSLNSIRALIDENKKDAKAMITELSEFLRHTLISKNYADVPLHNEIEAIRHYFAIEKKRYEDKIDVGIDIDPLAEDYPVLSFLIHPLVENAIKYGMKTSPIPLKIRIHAQVNDNILKIKVSNTGKWLKPATEKEQMLMGTGTGLENVRQRLENAFPERYQFKTSEKDGWVHIQIEIRKSIGKQS